MSPTGGGGYHVATALLGSRPGLVSGATLLADYVLTVATLLANGVDTSSDLLLVSVQAFRLGAEIVLAILIVGLNFRDIRGSIPVLLPIFIGFMMLYLGLVIYDVTVHGQHLVAIMPEAVGEAHGMS